MAQIGYFYLIIIFNSKSHSVIRIIVSVTIEKKRAFFIRTPIFWEPFLKKRFVFVENVKNTSLRKL